MASNPFSALQLQQPQQPNIEDQIHGISIEGVTIAPDPTTNEEESDLDALIKAPEKALTAIDQPMRLDLTGLRMYYGAQPFIGCSWTDPNSYLMEKLSTRKKRFAKDPAELIYELQNLLHGEEKQAPARKILRVMRSLTYYPPQDALLPEYIQLISSPDGRISLLAHYFVRACAPFTDMSMYQDAIDVLETEASNRMPPRRAAATKTLVRITRAREMRRAQDFVTDVFRSIGPGVGLDDKDKKKKKKKKEEAKDKEGAAAKAVTEGEEVSATHEGPRMVDDGAGGVIYSSKMETAERIRSKIGKMMVSHTVLSAIRHLQRINMEGIKVDILFFDAGLGSINPSTVRHTMAILESRTFVNPTSVATYLLPRLPQKNPPKGKRLILEDLGAKVYYARILGVLAQDPDLAQHVPEATPDPKSKTKASAMAAANPNATAEQPEKKGFFQFIFRGGKKLFGGMKRKLGIQQPMNRNDPIGVEFVESLLRLLQNPSNRILLEVLRGLSKRKWVTWTGVPVPQAALFGTPELEDTKERTIDDYKNPDDSDLEAGEDLVDDDEKDDDELVDGDFFDWDPESESAMGGESKLKDDEKPIDEDMELKVDDQAVRDASKKVGFFQKMKQNRATKREKKFDLNTPFYLRRVGDGYVTALEVVMRRIYASMNSDENIRRFAACESAAHLGRAKLYSDSEEDRDLYKKAKDVIYGKRAALGGKAPKNADGTQSKGLFARKNKNQSSLAIMAPGASNQIQPAAGTSATQPTGKQVSLVSKHSSSLAMVAPPSSSSTSKALVDPNALAPTEPSALNVDQSVLKEELPESPLEPLVMPLKEIMDEEEESMTVRAEAGTALVFFIASGAGIHAFAKQADLERQRKYSLEGNYTDDFYSPPGSRLDSCMLVRYFGSFLKDPQTRSGVGFEAAERVMDTLLYEVLEESPWLGVDAVELAEFWALNHPTVGPCGKLGLFWESLLSSGSQEAGIAVGASVARCLLVDPSRERVACAAAVFLRKRILDIAVLSAGMSESMGFGIPEPLPEDVGAEIERYFSALWHGTVMGPSAEARSLCLQALGGGAVLAGDPFRICTYERLSELVRARGFGLRSAAESVLDSLDSMYFARERLAEARSRMNAAGGNHAKWLRGVWKLAAESACAAQVILGCPPPPGWEPLGPEGSRDVSEAEQRFGNYRLREIRLQVDLEIQTPMANGSPMIGMGPSGDNGHPIPPPPTLMYIQAPKKPEVGGLKFQNS